MCVPGIGAFMYEERVPTLISVGKMLVMLIFVCFTYWRLLSSFCYWHSVIDCVNRWVTI